MPCTTLLVGKNATNDNSLIIARTDDGHFDVKKIVVVNPKDQPKIYKSKIGHLEIELKEKPFRYTSCPSVDLKNGIWAATGINEKNVGMTATETTTSNPRVLGLDPYVRYEKAKKKGEKDKPGGLGEEDFVVLVLPYIKTAREGVLRLGELLTKYGTYESNGIAFNDENEIWWFETIGGHHWMARKVEDDEYVVMPNQFGLDKFDFSDAYKEKKANLCSSDLKEFVESNFLNTSFDESNFNPRLAFGSHTDQDHVYNTPRGWYMCRYFNPRTFVWDGEDAFYTPESDDIPWSLKPEHKITIEDIKYILSSYYQGTIYNPYGRGDSPKKGMYRPIGINRTDVTGILQIRPNKDDNIKGIEWISFASNAFNVSVPLYSNVSKIPSYLSSVNKNVSLDNLYWSTRVLQALADSHYSTSIMSIERYQNKVMNGVRELLYKYDKLMEEKGKYDLMEEANQKIVDFVKAETDSIISTVLLNASEHMKNGYNRFDN